MAMQPTRNRHCNDGVKDNHEDEANHGQLQVQGLIESVVTAEHKAVEAVEDEAQYTNNPNKSDGPVSGGSALGVETVELLDQDIRPTCFISPTKSPGKKVQRLVLQVFLYRNVVKLVMILLNFKDVVVTHEVIQGSQLGAFVRQAGGEVKVVESH